MTVMAWPLMLLGIGCASGMQPKASEPRQHVVAANATSARSKRAECTSTQVAEGCCTPFGDTASSWATTTQSVHGKWSNGPASVRFDFEDDTQCGGPATGRQQGEASMTAEGPIDVTMSLEGVAEAAFEKFELVVNGAFVISVQASSGQGGSACQVGTCLMCDVSMAQQTFALPAGLNTIQVTADSSDGAFHQGAYFAIAFSTEHTRGEQCGSCTCPPSAPTTPSGEASAVGDPHLSNLRGEHFDIYRPGNLVLLQLPRRAQPARALLLVEADARRTMGDPCSVYFQAITISGAWTNQSEPIRFVANPHGKPSGTEWKRWMHFGTVDLKVTYRRKGTDFLNIYAKNLLGTGFAVGGLLGSDDHKEFSARPPKCSHRRAMLMASSVADARP